MNANSWTPTHWLQRQAAQPGQGRAHGVATQQQLPNQGLEEALEGKIILKRKNAEKLTRV